MHDLSLISTIAAGLTGAWLLGLVTHRLGLSPIVGYLLAGVLIGPSTPGFVGDVHIAQQLAEIGVILLMFGVGLHFHVRDLMAVKGIAIPGAVGQSLTATALAVALFSIFDMPTETGVVLGMAMSVASTVVLMRVLMDAGALGAPEGHVAVGWLIVEDIFTVVVLVLIPVIGSATAGDASAGAALWPTLGIAIVKLAGLVGVVLIGGARLVPRILVQVARLRSRELFTLTVLVCSIAIAAGSYFVFGASMALGAFLAGMVVAQSPVSHQAAADALPMRDAFAVLFFVSVGMLFDPSFLIEEPRMVLAGLAIILLAKPMAALLIVALLGHSARTALTVAIGLAQIGEFSFILSELARQYGLMPIAGHNVLVASAIISISLNPLLFRALPAIERGLQARPWLWRLLNRRAERRALAATARVGASIARPAGGANGVAIVVGYGPVGRSVHRLLSEANLATVVIDRNMDTIAALNAEGQPALFGDATREALLEQAGIRRASFLIVALPHSGDRAAVVATARHLNRKVRILVRAHYLREREELEQAGATAAVFEEVEAAVALARLVLADTGVHREAADQRLRDLRLHLITENVSGIEKNRVRGIMVPWSRVRTLSTASSREEVLTQVSQEPFSRWPVVETGSGRIVGYLLTKDLIAHATDADWMSLVRPLTAIGPDDSVADTLAQMQGASASMYAVEEAGRPVGLITLEDILELVVGRIEDEYPHAPPVTLADALRNGATLTHLAAQTGAAAIAELTAAIPGGALPPGTSRNEVLRLALKREEEISTNLGNGFAIPHARLPGLAAPIVVFGRSPQGVIFSPRAPDVVHALFLLVTPDERPEVQLTLISQVAAFCNDIAKRDALLRADSPADVNTALAARAAT